MWGSFEAGELAAACHVGANLVPVSATPTTRQRSPSARWPAGRTVSTIVGPQHAVRAFWNGVASSWGQPRETRWEQPHLEIAAGPLVAPDPLVRRTTRDDMHELYPACVAMYTEEVGVSPEYGGGADLYRARVTQLVNRGWSFARFDERPAGLQGRGRLRDAVRRPDPGGLRARRPPRPRPRDRGHGGGGAARAPRDRPGRLALRQRLEHAARAVYERVGFRETARFATVMF